jgi:hypothetical protein
MEYGNKKELLQIGSDTPPIVTDTVTAVGASPHGLYRNVLKSLGVFGSAFTS